MRRALADGYELDDDPERIDVDFVFNYLSLESYWARGRPREVVERSLAGSARVVGLYHGGAQVGFARVISDGAVLAYLGDVFVEAAHRGRGLGVALVREAVVEKLEDIEDMAASDAVMKRLARGQERTYSAAEVKRAVGL